MTALRAQTQAHQIIPGITVTRKAEAEAQKHRAQKQLISNKVKRLLIVSVLRLFLVRLVLPSCTSKLKA
jgi:hypothetical protein